MDKVVINRLVGIWNSIPKSYCKDSDFHFNISVWWSYDQAPEYFVEHKGYLYEFNESFNSMEEAEKFLATELISQIRLHLKDTSENHSDDYPNVRLEEMEAVEYEIKCIEGRL